MKEMKKKIAELYGMLLKKKSLTDKEEDVLTKLGECLDILNS